MGIVFEGRSFLGETHFIDVNVILEMCNGGYFEILLQPFPRANSIGETDTGMTRLLKTHIDSYFMDIKPLLTLIDKKFLFLKIEKILYPII